MPWYWVVSNDKLYKSSLVGARNRTGISYKLYSSSERYFLSLRCNFPYVSASCFLVISIAVDKIFEKHNKAILSKTVYSFDLFSLRKMPTVPSFLTVIATAAKFLHLFFSSTDSFLKLHHHQ